MNRFARLVAHWPLPWKRPGSWPGPPLWVLRLCRQRPQDVGVEGEGAGTALEPVSPLLWALLAAVLLHALALSYRSLSLRQRPQPAAPPLADDTPVLLEFSRRQPLEEALQSVPMAPPNSLPLMGSLPPPPASLPPNLASTGRLASPRLGSGRVASGTASSGNRSRRGSPERGRIGAASQPQAGGAGGQDHGSTAGPGAGVVTAALARIHRLQGRGEAGEPRATADLEPAAPAEPQRPEGEAAAAWRRLWKRAMVVPAPATPQALASEAMELRRLPLAQAPLDAGSRDEPTALVLDERLLLLWPDGPVLWLFWAPLRSAPAPSG
ncbi:MAG: hypothetical protein WCQ20_06525 [Synechococcaceae cyanobacterium ELA739]